MNKPMALTREEFKATFDMYSKENDIAVYLELYDEILAHDEAQRLTIARLEQERDALQARVRELEAQHEDLVVRNHLLRDRPDLPIGRLQAYDQLQKRIKELEDNQRRKPTDNETVCHTCDGSGWVDR